MVRLIILVILAYVLYRVVKKVFYPDRKIERGGAGGAIDEMVQDPFCKTYIPRRESVRRIIEGQEHRFCSDDCADKFELERKG